MGLFLHQRVGSLKTEVLGKFRSFHMGSRVHGVGFTVGLRFTVSVFLEVLGSALQEDALPRKKPQSTPKLEPLRPKKTPKAPKPHTLQALSPKPRTRNPETPKPQIYALNPKPAKPQTLVREP